MTVSFQEVVYSALKGNSEVAKHPRFSENRMETHENARLTPKGREAVEPAEVDFGLTKASAARHFNTTPKTAAKWSNVSALKVRMDCTACVTKLTCEA